ncbi:MAG: phosphoribosyltransferase family protein [Verrucomicrobiota bacterium]
MKIYRDRTEAGRLLGEAVKAIITPGHDGLLVLAIPRGGVVTGAEVARALRAPLDVWLARKIGAPGNPELAVGSVSSHGECFLDTRVIEALGVSQAYLEAAARREREELERRMILFRGSGAPIRVQGRHVVLVDDGVATGSTALSALAALRRGGAAQRILAVPVAPAEILPTLEQAADQVVVLNRAPEFYAVGQFYEQFDPVSDAEVIRILAEFR